MIELADIQDASRRIFGKVRRTPVLPLEHARLNPAPQCEVYFKLEHLQVSGSFKARGALNKILALSEPELSRGVVTASGGNHGLAVARSAHLLRTQATIFLPSNVVPDKVMKLRQWGATVQLVEGIWDDANELAHRFAQSTGACYIHPFTDPLVVAGQGTVGLELVEDLPDVDVVLVAIGGGGLISGVATALKAMRPTSRIIGIEPTGSPTLHACIAHNRLVALEHLSTRVATMSCRQTSQQIFEIVGRAVEEIVLVSDAEMEEAARWLWFEFGIAADLSGAAAAASLLAGRVDLPAGARVCALVCGSGTDGCTPVEE